MLVLTRKLNESLVFTDKRTGEDFTVTVVRCGPNQVRLGIDAPDHVNVSRQEKTSPDERVRNLSHKIERRRFETSAAT